MPVKEASTEPCYWAYHPVLAIWVAIAEQRPKIRSLKHELST
jgi:hypothetical protein